MTSKDDLLLRIQMWQTVESRIRSFFLKRGFTEVRTPLLVKSPGMEPNLQPFEVRVDIAGPPKTIHYQGALITSPEYSMKKLLGAGLQKIFTLTPVFRNGEAKNSTHLSEFMMLEWYGEGGYEELLQETEALLQWVLEDEHSWPRISYANASVDAFGNPHIDLDRFFLTHYPLSQASLAKLSENGDYAERFEAFADGLELCNGFAELTDANEQRRRFMEEAEERKRLGKTIFPIDEALLESLDKIKRPIYGNALGIDRLLMLKYGIKDIRDIQLIES